MKTILVTVTVFVSLLVILIPLDAKKQRDREAGRAVPDGQVADYEVRVTRGGALAPSAPRYPTDAEVADYWKARGGYGAAKE